MSRMADDSKDVDLERQYLLNSVPHIKIYLEGNHFSPKLPPALEGLVTEERFRETVGTVNDLWSPTTERLGKVFLVSILLMMVSFFAPFVLIMHWFTPHEHFMSIWVPVDIGFVLFNVLLFGLILFKSNHTKRTIRDFLNEENQNYNRIGLNFRLVQEKTLAGFAGKLSLYVDLLQNFTNYGQAQAPAPAPAMKGTGASPKRQAAV